MKNLERAHQCLERSKSNMARTKAGKVSPDILYEDLCYDAQQTVEKALKSLCILYEILFPKTHDIAYLIELLEKEKVEVPKDLQVAKILTGYAVETRYPGDYEPVNEDDYSNAVQIAEKVLQWVEMKIENCQPPLDPESFISE